MVTGVRVLLCVAALYVHADYENHDQESVESFQPPIWQTYCRHRCATNLNADGNLYYMSATGNANKVRAKGLEIDGSYEGIEHLSLPYRDASGQTLPGTAKYSFNVGADYRYPIFDRSEFRFSFNTAYLSKYKSDVALSEYSWIPAHSVTDLSLGIATTTLANNEFEVSLLVKNVFDDDTPFKQTWNLVTLADPRWAAIVVSGKL